MLRKSSLLGLMIAGLFVVTGMGQDTDKKAEKKFDAKCPVSGRAAKKDKAVAYAGGEVYMCCPNCVKAFKKDSSKFAAKANHQLVSTGQFVQKGCPFAGRKANPSTEIKVAGVPVSFCCKNCKGKAEAKSGDDQIALVFADGAFKKGFEKKKKDKKEKAG